MLNRFEEGICGVCARPDVGLGYAPKSHSKSTPIMWMCSDPKCHELARKTYAMRQDEFSRLESIAAQEGGNEGLWYLEDIGKTDLATLTIDEICEFKRRVIAGYRKALKAQMGGAS